MISPRLFTALIWCVLMVSTVTMVPCAATQTRADSSCSGGPYTDTIKPPEFGAASNHQNTNDKDGSLFLPGANAATGLGDVILLFAGITVWHGYEYYTLHDNARAAKTLDAAYGIYSTFFTQNIKEIDTRAASFRVACDKQKGTRSKFQIYDHPCDIEGKFNRLIIEQTFAINLPLRVSLEIGKDTFTKAASNVITTQKTALTTIQIWHDKAQREKTCTRSSVPMYCSQQECNESKERIHDKIVSEERLYSEYLADTYNKAKVDALYAASKDTDRTIFEELERLNEKVPRDTLHDEL